MSVAATDLLACPVCRGRLRTLGGVLRCDGGHEYPIVAGIPRFVAESAYTRSFGRQWNRWAQTQIDSVNGTRIFHERFERYIGDPADFAGARALDAGCGAGAFMDVVAPHVDELVGFDQSSSVEAAHANVAHYGNTLVAQADIFAPPVRARSFDLVYCIGVLQHTPDPVRAFAALADLVRPGGRLAVWVYERSPWEPIKPRHVLRRYTTRLSPPRADAFVESYTPAALRLRHWLARRPGGRLLKKMVPVADVHDYKAAPGRQLDAKQAHEWCLMDTHDMLMTTYDLPQRASSVEHWFRAHGFAPVRKTDAEAIAVVGVRES